MSEKHEAFVALGANLGEPLKALEAVIGALDANDSLEVVARSSFYQTEPIDSSGPDYVNAVIKVRTDLTPEALLTLLLTTENDFGRVRPAGVHNAPRTMDLDLLTYDSEVRSTKDLTLPHPRMHERAFVLVPMAEIDPDAVIVGRGRVKDFLPVVADQAIFRIP